MYVVNCFLFLLVPLDGMINFVIMALPVHLLYICYLGVQQMLMHGKLCLIAILKMSVCFLFEKEN